MSEYYEQALNSIKAVTGAEYEYYQLADIVKDILSYNNKLEERNKELLSLLEFCAFPNRDAGWDDYKGKRDRVVELVKENRRR